MTVCKIFALAVLLLLLTVSAAFAWQSLPAGEPVVRTLAADSSGQKIFVGLDSAGLWMTEDGGATWHPISTRLNPQGGIDPCSFIAADAAADTVLGLASCFVHATIPAMATSDGGDTWQELGMDPQANQYMIHPRLHNLWFRSHRDSLERSEDYGQTWTRCWTCTAFLQGHLTVDALADSVIYFTTYSSDQWPQVHPGVMRSTDWGQTWSVMLDFHAVFDNDGVFVSDVVHLSSGELLMAVMGLFPIWPSGHLVRSTDDGQTWTREMASPAVQEESRMFEARNHPGRLFLSDTCAGAVLRSEDYGRTWFEEGNGLPSVWTVCTLLRNSFSGELFAIYKGQGVYHTRNDGETWERLPLPPVGVSQGAFSVTPEAVFFRSEFLQGYEPLPVVEHELAFPYNAWREVNTPDTLNDSLFTLGAIFDKRADTLTALANIASPQSRYLPEARAVRSVNNGLTWEPVSRPPNWTNITECYAFHRNNGTQVIASVGFNADSFAISYDLGVTWQSGQRSEISHWYSPRKFAASEQALYMFAHDTHYESADAIYRSTDSARSWTLLENFEDGLNGLVVFGDTVHTVNRATHEMYHWIGGEREIWGQIPESLPLSGWHLVGVGGEWRTLVIVQPGVDSVWASNDAGVNWTAHASTFPYPTQNLRFGAPVSDPDRGRIWISAGTGVCYLQLTALAGGGPVQWQPADYELLSVYPNPFNAAARIRFDLNQAARVSLRVFDITGRLAATLTDGWQPAGPHEVLFDGKDLASGTYFVRLQTGQSAHTQKLLLLK